MNRNAKCKRLRRIELTIPVANELGDVAQRTVTAWVDKRYPDLAIQEAWELLPVEQWEVTHVASGRIIATLPSEATARAALAPLSKLLDWTQPAEAIVPAEPGEWRWLKQRIAMIVEHIKAEHGEIREMPRDVRHNHSLEIEPCEKSECLSDCRWMSANPTPRLTWKPCKTPR